MDVAVTKDHCLIITIYLCFPVQEPERCFRGEEGQHLRQHHGGRPHLDQAMPGRRTQHLPHSPLQEETNAMRKMNQEISCLTQKAKIQVAIIDEEIESSNKTTSMKI